MRSFLATVAAVLCFISPGFAQNVKFEVVESRETLRGETELRVSVLPIEELPGIADSIKTDTELKLRQNGITVTDGVGPNSLNPILYVNVNVLRLTGVPSFVYSIELQFARLLQVVIVPEKVTKFVRATSWDTSAVGIAPNSNSVALRDGVKDEVDKFVNDYLAANPKK